MHLRPDEDDSPAQRYFTRANAERYREVVRTDRPPSPEILTAGSKVTLTDRTVALFEAVDVGSAGLDTDRG